MKDSRLYALLSTLSEEEADSLDLFLRSPYFNKSPNSDRIRELFRVLIKPENSELQKEHLFSLIFPDAIWVQGKIEKLMTELTSMIREFLLVERHTKAGNDFSRSLDWAVELRKRGLMNRYPKELQKAERLLQEGAVESVEFYFNRFRLAYEKYDAESRSNKLKGDLHILPAIAGLDAYYLACRLEMLNLLLLQQKMTKLEAPPFALLSYAGFVSDEEKERNILLQISLKIYEQLIAEKPSADAFYEIFRLIQNHEHRIDKMVLQNFYAYLRNLCTLLIQMEDNSLLPVLHDIQKDNLEKGYILLDGKISPSAYLSVNRIALQVGKKDWALNFVEIYKHRLIDLEAQDDYYRYNKAEYLFFSGRMAEALEILPPHFSDAQYLTNCRRLELKLYYELRSDLLSYKVDAYKMFLSRASKNILSATRREFEGSFVNLLIQIINCPPNDEPKAARIIRRIREKKTVADRDWLLEKAMGLL